ncbi:DUF2442 domain-containing protein [candidate division KSB1 bacterium]|nr:DUF2442 domain-containing protein [candidate division KSB1 bacterium]
MLPKVIHVRHVGGYKLELSFSDGLKGMLDWGPRLRRAKAGGIFEPLQHPEYFAQVELWEGTIRWPNGADVCPEMLYEEISAGLHAHGEAREAMAAFAEYS